jgi:hypothetical protein
MKNLILAICLLHSFTLLAKTVVMVENHTSVRLEFRTTQMGYPLSQENWKQLGHDIAPGSTSALLEFNRDRGIKNRRNFVFSTQILNDGDKVTLLQLLQGRSVNSHMWQSLKVGTKRQIWNDTRKPKHVSITINGRPIRVTYRAVADGLDDNIVYSFNEIPLRNIGEEESKLTLLNYNIYMRPISLFKNGQMIRTQYLPEAIAGNDVINFSEAFDDTARAALLRNIINEYPYSTKVVGSDQGIEQDGGVIIVSKWPILEEDEYLFGELCFKDFEDCLSNKGIGYAKILKGTKVYHIFATHLQAGYTTRDKSVRRKQLRKLKDFVESKEIDRSEPIIMTGDFNIHRKELLQSEEGFDALEAIHDVLNPAADLISNTDVKNNYALMLKILGASGIPHSGHEFSFDPTINQLGKSSEPPELVEHVMFALGHLRPKEASQRVLIVKSREPWREFCWEDYIYDLSDHFPVQAEFQF